MTLKALIFDVDGTLAETEGIHLQAFNAAFIGAGLDWHWSVALYKILLGTTGGKERMLVYVRNHLDLNVELWRKRIPEIHAEKTKYYVDIVNGGGLKLRPGVQSLMDEAIAAGVRLAIATTTSSANVDALCRAIWGVEPEAIFNIVACGDEVTNKKPAPDVFNLALKRLGLPPSVCVGFEDSYNGMLASLGAGLTTIVVPSFYTGSGNFSAAKIVKNSYEEISLTKLSDMLA